MIFSFSSGASPAHNVDRRVFFFCFFFVCFFYVETDHEGKEC